MSTQTHTAQTANRIGIIFDGSQIGLVSGLTLSEDYSPEPAIGIGDLAPLEYVPTMARYQVQIEKMVLIKEKMISAGIQFQDANDALSGRVFNIVIADQVSGKTLKTIVGCTFASGNTQIRKNTMVTKSATFMALGIKGEM